MSYGCITIKCPGLLGKVLDFLKAKLCYKVDQNTKTVNNYIFSFECMSELLCPSVQLMYCCEEK